MRVGLTRLVAAACLALAAMPARADDAAPARVATEREFVESDYELRLSLPTEEDREEWTKPGLRVQLGLLGGVLVPGNMAPGVTLFGVELRPSMRVDERWSIAMAFQYASASGSFSGLRWSATLEPTFHLWRQLGLSVGVGYGGLSGVRMPLVMEPPDDRSQPEIATRTLDDDELLPASKATAG